MPPECFGSSKEELLLESLFHKERRSLLRYANLVLKKYGSSQVSISGRAEDVVQEVFFLAWEQIDDVLNSESPFGWLMEATKHKAREAIREDRSWVKHLMLITQSTSETGDLLEPSIDWLQWMEPEELELMVKFYLQGYSYKDLCEEYGLKKSALGMRIRRIKEQVRKNFKDF